MKQTIYAVEDDPALRDLYVYSLENEYLCRPFESGEAFFAALKENKPDLILLDIMLPGDDGFAILDRLKKSPSYAHIPVIMISARGDELSKVKGLNMGADDYMAKPFGVLEFLARIKANLRKSGSGASDIAYKDIVIDTSKHRITVRGEAIRATLKEFRLLRMLMENAGSVREREQIFSEVWGDGFAGETRTLDIHIKELRRKLEGADSAASIQTIRGVGYMLI